MAVHHNSQVNRHQSDSAGERKMCLNADELNPLCDECFAKEKSLGSNFTDKDICTDCKSALKHFCWCCMISYEDEIVEDGCCQKCREL